MEAHEIKRLMEKLIRVNRLHRSLIERKIAEEDIHRGQMHQLLYIMSSENPPSQKELAAAFEVTPAAIAMSMKKLEQKGLVTRVPDPSDSRVNLLAVSEKGKKLIEDNGRHFERIDQLMFDDIDEGEIASLRATLDKVTQNLIDLGANDETPVFMRPSKK